MGHLRNSRLRLNQCPMTIGRRRVITAPIVALQGGQAHNLYARVAKALNIRVDPRVLTKFVPPRDRSFLNIFKGFVKQRDDRLDSVLGVAFVRKALASVPSA